MKTQRVRAVLAALFASLLITVGFVAPASAEDYEGSFTSAYAGNPTPVLSEGTAAVFVVNNPLWRAKILIFDQGGSEVGGCFNPGTVECGAPSNPAPGTSLSYYAELWVVRDGAYVKYATSPMVTVTDPGWTGSFTEAHAGNPLPVLSEGTGVAFAVSAPLEAAKIVIVDQWGTEVGGCSGVAFIACGAPSNPAPGTSMSYHADLWVVRNGAFVKYATSPSVTITDPGWTGSFTSAHANPGDEDFRGASSARFTWDEPLQYAAIAVVDDAGVVLGTCSAPGSLECSAGLALGPDESRTVHAEARVSGIAGGSVAIASSGSVVLTGMDTEAYVDLMMTAPLAELAALVGPARAAQIAEARTAMQSETFCVSLGQELPSNKMFHSSTPDATLLCMAGTVGGVALMGYLVATMGVDQAMNIMAIAAGTDDGIGAPSLDPNERARIYNTPDCRHYNVNGVCLDTTSNPAEGSHVQNVDSVPSDWWPSDLICRAIRVDPVTGTTETFELRTDGLKHLVENHVARPPTGKSVWDKTRFNLPSNPQVLAEFEDETSPEDYAELITFLCDSLAQGELYDSGASEDTPGNTVRIHVGAGGFVGIDGASSAPTVKFTAVVTPAGEIWSAYPGESPIAP